MKQPIALLVVITLLSFLAHGSDLAKEKRWADQIVDALLDGEAVTLNDGSNDFLAIYTEAETPKPLGVLLLHGIGAHPDWTQVVQPLRVGLAEQGWTTLSLQLPILPNEATGKDYIPLMGEVAPRLKAGIAHLKAGGSRKIAIVAHSLGTVMAAYALAKGEVSVTAFAAIGMGEAAVPHLDKITIPLLDFYGSDDLDGVVDSAAAREQTTSKNTGYKQIVLKDADHFFNDREKELVEQVADWLGAFD